MSLYLLPLWIAGLIGGFSFQASAQSMETAFATLNSSRLRVFPLEESHQFKSKTYALQALGLAWSPSHIALQPPEGCRYEDFFQSLTNTSQPESVISTFWNQCEGSWRSNTFNPWTHAQEVLRMGFEPADHPAVRVIEWQLQPKLKLKGYLFL